MKFINISIINFRKKLVFCQWKEGFLLLELMYALIIALLMYGIAIHWQQAIYSLAQEAKLGLKALDSAHDTFERMIADPSWVHKKEFCTETINLTWKHEAVFVEEAKKQLPPLNLPQNFYTVSMDISWPGAMKKHSMSLFSGFIIHA